MIKKGIVLAGGKGTRLSPITKSVNKQLLPIYDKPLFFYPLSILMLADIRQILLIVNKGQKKNFYKIIGNGKHLGLKINYEEQNEPNGIPESFKIGEKFIGSNNVALIAVPDDGFGPSGDAVLLRNASACFAAKLILI